jgi:hypothetical protein
MVHCLLVKIVSHFVNHSTTQNDKVKIDLSRLTQWVFLHLSFLVFFLLKNPIEKTMNCSSEMITKFDQLWHNKSR